MRLLSFVALALVAGPTLQAGAQEDKGIAAALATIKRLGGTVEMDGKDRIIKLSLQNSKVTSADLAFLDYLDDLQDLDLSHTAVTGKGLASIEGCTKLTRLNLAFTKVSDTGLQHLKTLKRLKWLDLERQDKDEKYFITDAGLKHLKSLKSLEYVNLTNHHATEAGLKDFQKALPRVKIGPAQADAATESPGK